MHRIQALGINLIILVTVFCCSCSSANKTEYYFPSDSWMFVNDVSDENFFAFYLKDSLGIKLTPLNSAGFQAEFRLWGDKKNEVVFDGTLNLFEQKIFINDEKQGIRGAFILDKKDVGILRYYFDSVSTPVKNSLFKIKKNVDENKIKLIFSKQGNIFYYPPKFKGGYYMLFAIGFSNKTWEGFKLKYSKYVNFKKI